MAADPALHAVSEAVGETVTPETLVSQLPRSRNGTTSVWTRPVPGKVVEELFEALVQHTPGADVRHRLSARHLPVDPRAPFAAGLAEKWDLYIGGIERATAYSELVDLVAQRERFGAQVALLAAGW